MKTKLTLRVEEALVEKAKRLARQKGTSVSSFFGDFILDQDEPLEESLPPITATMVGILNESSIDESDYKAHLERKYL